MSTSTSILTAYTPAHPGKYARTLPYYRSQIYTSYAGRNPLITAAQPIFSILERLLLSRTSPDLSLVQEKLLHEIKAFTTYIQTSPIPEEIQQVARFLISATIDEILQKTCTLAPLLPDSVPLLLTQEEREYTPRFFEILERVLEKPKTYPELLDLLYLCLRTGFEGKFRDLHRGKEALDTLLDQIYQTIKKNQPDPQESLFIAEPPTREPLLPKTNEHPWATLSATLFFALAMSYFVANYTLSHQSQTLLTTFSASTPIQK